MNLSDALFWKKAINSEMNSITNNTMIFFLTHLLEKKLRTNVIIETFNARLITKGFKQKEGVDFFDICFTCN